jgi:hypothetical protein
LERLGSRLFCLKKGLGLAGFNEHEGLFNVHDVHFVKLLAGRQAKDCIASGIFLEVLEGHEQGEKGGVMSAVLEDVHCHSWRSSGAINKHSTNTIYPSYVPLLPDPDTHTGGERRDVGRKGMIHVLRRTWHGGDLQRTSMA